MQIRAALPEDIAAIQAIYAHHVLHGLGTFETEPPGETEMLARYEQITAAGYPYLVVTFEDQVLGYAYANHFRARAAYSHTVEDSIYVAPHATGRRVGRTVLDALVARCTVLGFRQMLAVIGDSANAASIGVHRSCGFEHTGVMRAVGRKFDQWVDVVIMQRALGPGADTPPE